MPPKLSKSAKQALIVSHLRSTRTCHTLRDLEKMLPSIASINGIQVKEYIQELTNEGQITMEKIGNGNWYWCFSGDAKKERERQVSQLRQEVERLQVRCHKTEAELATRREKKQAEECGGGSGTSISSPVGVEEQRKELMERKKGLEKECNRLRAEWTAVSTTGEGMGIQQMRKESDKYRQQAQTWTDNIYVLEEYLRKLTGGDREIVQAVQREVYGADYVEGEGLEELNF